MTSLQIGDTAPNFQSFDEAGNSVSLADYNGKKLVLFFYPKASFPRAAPAVQPLSYRRQEVPAKQDYHVSAIRFSALELFHKWVT